MDRESFAKQIDALATMVRGFAMIDTVEDHLFGGFQGSLLYDLQQADDAGLERSTTLAIARPVVQQLVQLAERDDLTLSTELEALIDEYSRSEPITQILQLSPAKPLATFPTERNVRHTVFVDESGTASFDEDAQPVMCLVGVLVEDARIDEFTWATNALLSRYGVIESAEIHTQEVLGGAPPFDHLPSEAREELLLEFMRLGLAAAVGVHHISMLKPLVEPEFRQQMLARGLNAYTANLLYFNLTLQVGAIAKIGLAKYRYLFDRTDSYGKDIRRILEALRADPNPGLRVGSISGLPTAVDSRDHRFVQLADAIGYYLTRYRQFEVKTFAPRDSLVRHREKYEAVYALIRPKLLNYVKEGLYRLVDWKALQAWTHPKMRAASSNGEAKPSRLVTRVGRNDPCPCGSGKKYKKCHGR